MTKKSPKGLKKLGPPEITEDIFETVDLQNMLGRDRITER